MTSQHHFNLLTRIWIGLGWLQPGQPLHEAQIPQDLLDTQPAIAEIIEEHRHHNPHAPAAPTEIRTSQFELPPADTPEIRTSQFELPPPQSEIHNPKSEMPFDSLLPDLGEGLGVRVATRSVSTPEPEHPRIPEPETPENQTKKLRRRSHCRGLTKAGNPCYAYKLIGSDLCVFHNAKAINEQEWDRAAEQFDPAAVAEAKTAVIDLELLPLQLNDNASLLAFTEGIIRLELAGTLPASTSRRIASYLRIAQRLLPSVPETRTEPEPAAHQGRISYFVQAAPHVRHRLEHQDHRQRTLEVEHAGRKREAILQMNRQYAPTPINRPPKLPSLRALMKY